MKIVWEMFFYAFSFILSSHTHAAKLKKEGTEFQTKWTISMIIHEIVIENGFGTCTLNGKMQGRETHINTGKAANAGTNTEN